MKDLLAVIDRHGTRLELICWRLDLEEERVVPAWHLALRKGLLEPRGADPFTGRTMYVLSERGRCALRTLRGRRRPPRPTG